MDFNKIPLWNSFSFAEVVMEFFRHLKAGFYLNFDSDGNLFLSFKNLNLWRLLNYIYCILFVKRSKKLRVLPQCLYKPREKSTGNEVVVWSLERNGFSWQDVFSTFLLCESLKRTLLCNQLGKDIIKSRDPDPFHTKNCVK